MSCIFFHVEDVLVDIQYLTYSFESRTFIQVDTNVPEDLDVSIFTSP